MYNWLLSFFESRTFGAVRSSKWNSVQKAHLEKEPYCAVCGTKGGILNSLNVHHQKPFHLHPELELDDANLITLCRRDHLFFGHLNDWSSYNSTVREDATVFRDKLKNRP